LFAFLLLSGCGGASNSSSNTVGAVNTDTSGNPTSSIQIVAGSQAVTIDSPDGVKLVGTFLDAGKPNSPALLLLHQWQSDRHSYDEFATRMNASGFNVLSIDGRGFGESTKKADGSTVSAGRSDEDVKGMLGDVGAAFDFLEKQKNVDPNKIGIVGASYGSSLAIIYAADNPKVAGVALLSPGLNYFGNMPIEPAVKKFNRHLFMFAAEDDKDSADAVRALLTPENEDKYDHLIYPAGGHGTALLKVGASDEMEEFFTNLLKLKRVL
jgi:dienelactone hydrolase